MAPLDVRRAALDDIGALAPLFDAYRRFYRRPSDEGACARFLRDRLERDESVVLLATLDARAAGFTQLYRQFSSVRLGRLWLLNDLFVAPDARRRGVAQALLTRARDFAAESDALGLTLRTERSNAAAQALYERLGWSRDEVFLTYDLAL